MEENTTPASPTSYSGKMLNSCTVADLKLMETCYPASLRMPRHTHEDAYFSMTLRGGYSEMAERTSRVCAPASVVFHPAEEAHAVEFHDTKVRIFRVVVGPRWSERVRPYSGILDTQAEFQGGIMACLGFRLYQEFCRRDTVAPLAMEGLVLEILAEASRHQPERTARYPPRWLQQVQELLHAQFRTNMPLEEIAGLVGVHPVHLARAFRAHHRCTLSDYVRRLRIEFTCRQLVSSDLPLCQIALTAGFADQAHFSRTFKQFTGLTPTEYKKGFASR
jgi:AraC family transcriptional regulator